MKPLKVDRRADKIYLEGTFLDLENSNGRKYNLDSTMHQVRETQHVVGNGNMLGELGHPERNEVKLSDVSHKITGLWVDPMRKELNGKLEILDGTPKGQMAKKLVEKETPLNVAMRASGSINDKGEVELDKIYSFDLVTENSNDMPGQFTTDKELSTYYSQDSKPEKKKLLIFAVYVNVGAQSEARARTRLKEVQAQFSQTFDHIQKQMPYYIESFFIPIKDGNGETKMELVYEGDVVDFKKYDFSQEYPPEGFTVGEQIEDKNDSDYSDLYGKDPMYEMSEPVYRTDHRTQSILDQMKKYK